MSNSNSPRDIVVDDVSAEFVAALSAAAQREEKSVREIWIEAAQRLAQPEVRQPAQPSWPAPAASRPRPAPHFGFRFVDLLAGIGGYRIALERLGGTCVFACDADPAARSVYERWFGVAPAGDILGTPLEQVPAHDVLAAGFPIEPFTTEPVKGVRVTSDTHRIRRDAQGKLFLRVCSIVRRLRPTVLILEFADDLMTHGGQQSWGAMHDMLCGRLGYHVHARVVDESLYVPQRRRRTVVVGFRRLSQCGESPFFCFPTEPRFGPTLLSVLEPCPDVGYTLDDREWGRLAKEIRAGALGAGGTEPTLIDPVNERAIAVPELRRNVHPEGLAVLIDQGAGRNPRRLSRTELARLAGFASLMPSADALPAVDEDAARLFANATVPSMAEAVAAEALRILDRMRAGASGGLAVDPRWYRARSVIQPSGRAGGADLRRGRDTRRQAARQGAADLP